MYTLDYVKNYEDLDQTCNIIKSIVVLDNGCIKEETTYNKYAMK